ncbi:hypothetical protein HDU85_007135 [Gaertneriomyces sp. JEL0708]|nr:hypothetical protein HDU85_007135 [Gaertneriomyces sp. JEL0708]
MLPFFKLNGCQAVRDLMALVKGEPLAAHDALKALINLSTDPTFVSTMDDEKFLYELILLIVLPRNVLADLCCMLLNNLSESNSISRKLVTDISPSTLAQPPSSGDDQAQTSPSAKTHYLDNLLEVFVRGEGKRYNPAAEYHFLGGVLANVAMTPAGAEWFRGRTGVDGMLRLSKVVPFVEHDNRIRRSAAIAIVKNTAFVPEGHQLLLTDTELNLLPYILLPLSGPEDYTDEEMEGMPDELQLLEPDKRREPDAKLRLALVETLSLLTTTRPGREILRAKKVYPVVQKLHLQEKDEKVQEAIENLVQMLCREEEPAGSDMSLSVAKKITNGPVDRDYVIEEVDDSDEDEDVSIEPL